MEVEVNTLEKQNKKDTNANKKAKEKLPFAVFICPKSNIDVFNFVTVLIHIN